jgi:hypothetical protein
MSSHDEDLRHAKRILKRLKSINDRLGLVISSEFAYFEGKDYDDLTAAEAKLAAVQARLRKVTGEVL